MRTGARDAGEEERIQVLQNERRVQTEVCISIDLSNVCNIINNTNT